MPSPGERRRCRARSLVALGKMTHGLQRRHCRTRLHSSAVRRRSSVYLDSITRHFKPACRRYSLPIGGHVLLRQVLLVPRHPAPNNGITLRPEAGLSSPKRSSPGSAGNDACGADFHSAFTMSWNPRYQRAPLDQPGVGTTPREPPWGRASWRGCLRQAASPRVWFW